MATNLWHTHWHEYNNTHPSRAGRVDYKVKWNLISWADFQWRVNYLVMLEALDVWKTYPNIDDGSQDFFIEELRACTKFEVMKIKRDLDFIISDFYETWVKTRFLNDIHNACIGILRKKTKTKRDYLSS